MKRFYLPLLLLFGWLLPMGGLQVRAQSAYTSIDSVLVSMPDSLLPLLRVSDRLDCIDFLKNDMSAVVTNKLGGRSRLLVRTPHFLHLATTPSSDVQLRLLPLPHAPAVVCVVQTLFMPQPLSRIAFYTQSWQPLPLGQYLSSIATKGGDEKVLSVGYTLHTQGDSLTARTYGEGLKVPPSTPLGQVTYVWREGRFEPQHDGTPGDK